MDFLKQILSDKGAELAAGIVDKVGLSAEQAEAFVPEAAQSAFDVFKDKADDLDLSDLGGTASSLIKDIDVGGLANKVGIDAGQAASGLDNLLPGLLSALNDKAGALGGLQSVVGMLKGGGVADALGNVGGLAGKLFGK